MRVKCAGEAFHTGLPSRSLRLMSLAAVKSKAKVLAQMTSLEHLLERKVEELEGSENATSLEQDIQILEVASSEATTYL